MYPFRLNVRYLYLKKPLAKTNLLDNVTNKSFFKRPAKNSYFWEQCRTSFHCLHYIQEIMITKTNQYHFLLYMDLSKERGRRVHHALLVDSIVPEETINPFRLNRLPHTIYLKRRISILGKSGYVTKIFLERNGLTICKQWRRWLDATERGIWSGSALFASYPLDVSKLKWDIHVAALLPKQFYAYLKFMINLL